MPIDIISASILPFEELRRAKTMKFANEDIKFSIFTKNWSGNALLTTRPKLAA